MAMHSAQSGRTLASCYDGLAIACAVGPQVLEQCIHTENCTETDGSYCISFKLNMLKTQHRRVKNRASYLFPHFFLRYFLLFKGDNTGCL